MCRQLINPKEAFITLYFLYMAPFTRPFFWILHQQMSFLRIATLGASLVAQWLRICLPMQGTRVRALVWEDPACCGAANPVRHNY